MTYGLHTSVEYTQYLADLNNPQLNKLWGVLDLCRGAQTRLLTEFTLDVTVPLAVVTWITSNLQFTVTSTVQPGNMRRITKIKF